MAKHLKRTLRNVFQVYCVEQHKYMTSKIEVHSWGSDFFGYFAKPFHVL